MDKRITLLLSLLTFVCLASNAAAECVPIASVPVIASFDPFARSISAGPQQSPGCPEGQITETDYGAWLGKQQQLRACGVEFEACVNTSKDVRQCSARENNCLDAVN